MKRNEALQSPAPGIVSLATLTAGALIKPSSIVAVESAKSAVRFAVLGDWGTGDADQIGLAKQMIHHHQATALDFVLTTGDNIYPNGSGRHFRKKFEEPFAIARIKSTLRRTWHHDARRDGQISSSNHLNWIGRTTLFGRGMAWGLLMPIRLCATGPVTGLKRPRTRSKVEDRDLQTASYHRKRMAPPNVRKCANALVHYGFSVVFSGQEHYERTLPQQGIQYFVTGAGGQTRRGGLDMNTSIRAVSYDEDNHFLLIELDDQGVGFKAISEQGTIVDSGVIKQT